TFGQFAAPLMRKLGWPTLFCNSLVVDGGGHITGYRLRIEDGKRRAVEALRGLAFRVVAAGGSDNDTTTLAPPAAAILFPPPPHLIADFPQSRVARPYAGLRDAFVRAGKGEIAA